MTSILHLVTSLDVGGTQRMLLRLVRALDAAEFPARVVTLVPGGALAGEFEAAGIPVEALGLRPGSVDPRGLWRLRRVLRRERPDVLQTWLCHADLLGALVAGRTAAPALAWNLRSSGQADSSLLRGLVLKACARLSSRPDVVVTNSEAGRRHHAALGFHPRRWEVIPNGFPTGPAPTAAARERARAALGIAAHEVCTLTLARRHPSKGVDLLLRALVRAELTSLPLVALVAGEGLARDELEVETGGAVQVLLTSGRLRLLGLRRDVDDLLSACDFLVLPSRFEGFPNVVGEALAAARPCVATDVGDVRAVLGRAGLVVPTEDPAALAAAIGRLASIPQAEREALGSVGRESLAARFSLERVAGRYAELYAGLVRP